MMEHQLPDDPRLRAVLARWRDDEPSTWVLWPTTVRELPRGLWVDPTSWVGHFRQLVLATFHVPCEVLDEAGRAVPDRTRLNRELDAEPMWMWPAMAVAEVRARFADRYHLTLVVHDRRRQPADARTSLGQLAVAEAPPTTEQEVRRELTKRLAFVRSAAELCDVASDVLDHLGDTTLATAIVDRVAEATDRVPVLQRLARLCLQRLADVRRAEHLLHLAQQISDRDRAEQESYNEEY